MDPRLRILEYLARRDRSEKEIGDRLRQWNCEAPEIDEILQELIGRGLVDDRALAEKVRDWHIRKDPVGPPRLRDRLRQRGIPAEIASEVSDSIRDEELLREMAKRLVLRRLPSLLPLAGPSRVRRLSSYLSRRGFPGALVRELCLPLYREDLEMEEFEE
jgi:regulatory protein